MGAIKGFLGQCGLTNDDFVSAATNILCTGDIIHGFKNPQGLPPNQTISNQEACQAVIENPNLAIGIVLLARLERMHFDYLASENTTHLLLEGITESLDCLGAKHTEFWMQSDLAAMDKAKELGINILPDYSMADLRYKIHCAIQEAN